MEDFYGLMEYLHRPVKKVLATIINVTGSTYKKEGSSMLFFEDETQAGMLSAGCLEADLAHQARKVMKTGKPICVQYDMREVTGLSWGQGAGCNGMIEIFIEPVSEQLTRDFLKLNDLLASNIPVLGLKKLHSAGEYVFVPDEGEPFGYWKGEINAGLHDVKSGLIMNSSIFQHLFLPKPRLVVIGAGPDAMPLVSLAAKTGFSVTVCDWRDALCKKENFPEADQLLVGFPSEIMEQLVFSRNDFILIMSHDFQRDQEITRAMLQREVKYLGVLGPRERTRRLLNDGKIPLHLHSPVGMSIGAQGPEEIAISVMAEMIQVLRKPIYESVEHLWTIPE